MAICFVSYQLGSLTLLLSILIVCFIITENPHKWRGFIMKYLFYYLFIYFFHLILANICEIIGMRFNFKCDRIFLGEPIISEAKISDIYPKSF